MNHLEVIKKSEKRFPEIRGFASIAKPRRFLGEAVFGAKYPRISPRSRNAEIQNIGETGFQEVDSLWGGCCQLPLYVSYRPVFKTWVRIRYFGALSICGPTAHSANDRRGSKVFAKRALEEL